MKDWQDGSLSTTKEAPCERLVWPLASTPKAVTGVTCSPNRNVVTRPIGERGPSM